MPGEVVVVPVCVPVLLVPVVVPAGGAPVLPVVCAAATPSARNNRRKYLGIGLLFIPKFGLYGGMP